MKLLVSLNSIPFCHQIFFRGYLESKKRINNIISFNNLTEFQVQSFGRLEERCNRDGRRLDEIVTVFWNGYTKVNFWCVINLSEYLFCFIISSYKTCGCYSPPCILYYPTTEVIKYNLSKAQCNICRAVTKNFRMLFVSSVLYVNTYSSKCIWQFILR